MRKKILIYATMFTVALAVFYIAIYHDYDFSASTMGIINDDVKEFSFINQNADTITAREVEEKVYVAAYFFTTCRGICPPMNANLRRVYDKFKDEPGFAILSHTCMPEVDSLPQLKEYQNWQINGQIIARKDGSYIVNRPTTNTPITNSNWHFLYGPKEQLYQMARQSYLIDDNKPKTDSAKTDEFLHTQFFALVDKYRRVRRIYDGLNETEVQELITDIPRLLKEKVTTKRFMNGFSNNPE
jgi:protein SCO1